MLFERLAQSLGGPRTGFAMAQRNLLFEHLQHRLHRGLGTGALRRIHLGPLRAWGGLGRVLPALGTDLIGPGRHRRQGQAGVCSGRFGL